MKHLITGIVVFSSILFSTGCEKGIVDPYLWYEMEFTVKNATDKPVEITFYKYEVDGGEISKLLLPANDSYYEKIGESTSYIMTSPDLDKYGLQSAIDVLKKEKVHFVFADGKELWHKCQTIESHIFPEGILDLNKTWEHVKADSNHTSHTYTIDEALHEQATVVAEE